MLYPKKNHQDFINSILRLLYFLWKKMLLHPFLLILRAPLFGQNNALDSLAQLSPTASIKKRVLLKIAIDKYLDTNKDEALTDRYLEIAKTKNDSIFLEPAYLLKGQLEAYQNIQRNYGYHIRLRKALELLKTIDLNISEIAYDVGFNDPNYFSRSFHKLFGKSPSLFRS